MEGGVGPRLRNVQPPSLVLLPQSCVSPKNAHPDHHQEVGQETAKKEEGSIGVHDGSLFPLPQEDEDHGHGHGRELWEDLSLSHCIPLVKRTEKEEGNEPKGRGGGCGFVSMVMVLVETAREVEEEEGVESCVPELMA